MALVAVKEDKTLAKLAEQFSVHPMQIIKDATVAGTGRGRIWRHQADGRHAG